MWIEVIPIPTLIDSHSHVLFISFPIPTGIRIPMHISTPQFISCYSVAATARHRRGCIVCIFLQLMTPKHLKFRVQKIDSHLVLGVEEYIV